MRAFYNRAKPFEQALKKAGIDVFVPPMPSLFFIRATVRYIRELKRIYYDSLMFYAEPGTSDPAAVKDREMEERLTVSQEGWKSPTGSGNTVIIII